MNKQKNILVTFTGPSCSGKTTLLNELMTHEGFGTIVSHTTRAMRPGEVDGVDYHFVTKQVFDTIEFIEKIDFNGAFYGVSAGEMSKVQESGKVALLIVEPRGLDQIRHYIWKKLPDVQILSYYMDVALELAIARYLTRLVLPAKGDGYLATHAKRMASIADEIRTWGTMLRYDKWFLSINEEDTELLAHKVMLDIRDLQEKQE